MENGSSAALGVTEVLVMHVFCIHYTSKTERMSQYCDKWSICKKETAFQSSGFKSCSLDT